MAEQPHILFCRCVHYEVIPPASKERVLASLSQAGPEVEVVDDLCGLAARRDLRMSTWAAIPSLAVVACFPRAIRWLFHAAGAPLPQQRVRFLNMRTQPPEQIVQELTKADGQLNVRAGFKPAPTGPDHKSDWVPWFPVIDYDRCKSCKQCLNFCLFGVYALSEDGKVQVCKPAGCKTNCPACARMCPQKAIIFPKYTEAPINGDEGSMGTPPMDSEHGQDARATGDVYDRIRQRGAGRKRFSNETPGSSPGPSCPTLDALRRELGVPDDVLASLSPAELQRIASQRGMEQPQTDSEPQGSGEDKLRNG